MYRKGNVPGDAAALPAFLNQELSKLETGLQEPVSFITLSVNYAQPAKVWDGMTLIADGTRWNPGSGSGLYYRLGGVWIKAG